MSSVKVCCCCLSADRKLSPIGKHVKLYLKLLLKKSNSTSKKQIQLCWECYKILDNIQAFRLRVTKAQNVLNDKSMVLFSSLSTLSSVKLTNYGKMIIYDDMKDRIPLELEIDVIKDEKHEESTEGNDIKKHVDVIENDADDVKEPLKVEAVKYEDDNIFAESEITFDIELADDKEIKKELDEPVVNNDVLENKVVKLTRNRGVLKKKYRTIIMDNIKDKRNLYDKVTIDEKGLAKWLERKKKSRNTKQFQCERCFCGFSKQKFYDHHLAVRHAKNLGKYECDICGFRFAEKRKLSYHVRAHFVQFVCRLCALACGTRNEMYMHFAHGPHGKQQECKKCGLRFDCRRRREFFDHYRYMHETHICDHCGRNFGKKSKLVAHIYKHHTIHRCKLCNVTYSTLDSYTRHHRERHVVDASEQNYCVECNMQFINSARYNMHLKRSVRHRPNKAFPCQECGKVYTKHCSMVNHYNLVHLKKSKYHCAPCDTYFLTGYRLHYHQKYFHEKRPKPKNKLCKFCGKGFTNNRMLDNHVRTHTGERPFACTQCTAAFTQKQSLKAHVRSAHNKH